jgi:hypothetical protein
VPPKTDIAVPRHAPHRQSKIRGAALNHGLLPAANESPQRIRDGASTKAELPKFLDDNWLAILTVLEEAKPEPIRVRDLDRMLAERGKKVQGDVSVDLTTLKQAGEVLNPSWGYWTVP